MASVWTIAFNTWEGALRRKIIYILLFVALLFGAQALYGTVYMDWAEAPGDIEARAQLHSQLVLWLFGIMEFWSTALAVFLGSVAISSEIKNRTIVSVLSRPIERWQFFLAKWLGTLAFLAMFLGAGAMVGIALCWFWALYPSAVFAIGIAELLLRLAVVSAVCLALSSIFNPVLAGGLALVIFYLRNFTWIFTEYSRGAWKVIADVGYFLAPAQIPDSLLEGGLVTGLLAPNYALYSAVLLENALYALAAVIAGTLVFQQREIALK